MRSWNARLTTRMMAAAEAEQFEAAARLRDQLSTVHQLQEKQRIATAEQERRRRRLRLPL